MKQLFVAHEIQYCELEFFSFNSQIYFLTRGFIASTRAFNLPTRTFNLATRAVCVLTHGFELVTRRFELITLGFKLVNHGFEQATRGFEIVTRGFELVTRVLLFLIYVKQIGTKQLRVEKQVMQYFCTNQISFWL